MNMDIINIMSVNEKIKLIFDQFDKNNNGNIEKKELGALAIALNNPLSNPELQDLFKGIDSDLSGQITFEEFIKYWKS